MVNLYQVLNIPANANSAQIQAALMRYQQLPNANPKMIEATQAWLLKADVRARYDAKLRAEFPDFFMMPTAPVATKTAPARNPAPARNTAAKTVRLKAKPQRKAFDSDEVPYLWNPNAAALWSLLFTPIFGAWLHMRNWQELGDKTMARKNLMWIIAYPIAALALPIGLLLMGIDIPNIWGWLLLLVWYLTLGKTQIQLVKEEFGGDYERRSWWLPLLLGIVFTIVFGLAILFIGLLLVGSGAVGHQ